MQTNPEQVAKGIEMSARGLVEWQTALKDCGIDTARGLLDELVLTDIARPTVTKAFKGEKVAQSSWKKIFTALDFKRETFFTDAEWNGWNRETVWKNLWGLAENADERFGLVLPQQIEHAGLKDVLTESVYQKRLISGKKVLLKIPAGLSGYLILVEQDALGSIELISPSCLVTDPKLTGDVRLLPQYPPSAHKFFIPTTLGTNSLWAGIFTQLPEWEWLKQAQAGVLSLTEDQLMDLWNYASKPPLGSQIWRSSYVVVSP